jgi:hypothetical protein
MINLHCSENGEYTYLTASETSREFEIFRAMQRKDLCDSTCNAEHSTITIFILGYLLDLSRINSQNLTRFYIYENFYSKL